MIYSVRQATPDDLPVIADIFTQGVEDGVATLDTDLQDENKRNEWLSSKSDRYKVLAITDEEERVCGWASLNPYSERECLNGIADISIYIRREMRGMGLGKRLLDALAAEARIQGFHKLVLAAHNANEMGKRLYRFIGFREVGVYLKHEYRNGRWHDIVIMEKLLY